MRVDELTLEQSRWLRENNQGEPWHNQRYMESWSWIKPCIGSSILEFGGESIFTTFLRKYLPSDVTLASTKEQDLRYDLVEPSNSHDLILCMEVMEHVRDRNESKLADFTGSGIRSMLSEAYRILRPGGHLLLTTPNVCGLMNLERVAAMAHPFFYQPHHRELTPDDVEGYLNDAHFTIKKIETKIVWNHHRMSKVKIEKWTAFLANMGYPVRGRGDCIFALGYKG